jgi:type I restriction enzyme S subunit
LRHVAQINPPVSGLGRQDAGRLISFLPLDRIWSDGRFDPSEVIEFSGDPQSYNVVADHDLLVPKVSPTFAHGRTAVALGLRNGVGLATSEVFVVRPFNRDASRFLKYRLLAADFLSAGVASWTGVAGLKRISGRFLKNVWIDPAVWERRLVVADFLDRECDRITKLQTVRDTAEQLRSELDESARRAALNIGIDGGRTVGSYFRLQRGIDLPDDQRHPGEVPVIGSGGIVGHHDQAALFPPAVITGRYGSVGRVHWSEEPCWPLNTTLYISDFYGANPRFAYWVLRSLPLREEAGKSAVPGLHRKDIGQLRLGDFTWEAQVELSSRFDAGAVQLSRFQEVTGRLRKRVNEYCDALITEAVTGHLDVSRLTDTQLDESARAALEGEHPEVLSA